MQQRVYVISSNESVKVGVSRDPLKRLAKMQCGSPVDMKLIYQTDFCDNAESVESVCHVSLRSSHERGEWFHIDTSLAIDIVLTTFQAISINSSPVEMKDDKLAFDGIFGMFDSVSVANGMFRATDIVFLANKHRESSGLPEKQLGSFFNTELSKNLITQSCLSRLVPVDLVKKSVRGKFGGTYVDEFLASALVEWCTGVKIAGMASIVNRQVLEGGK